MDITQAVILAGGRGERLRPLTDTIPKPMVSFHGKPFLEYLIEMLKENGIRDIVLLLGYLPEQIINYFGDGSRWGVRVQYSITPASDDTGARLRAAKRLFRDTFLLMYCDNFWPLDLQKLSGFYRVKNVPASVVVYTNKHGITKNNMHVDEEGFVTVYDKKREVKNLNGVEIGFFILQKDVLGLLPDGNVSFEKEVMPRLIADRALAGFMTDHRYYSVGSLERLPQTEEFLRQKKVLFLDRDGTINKKPKTARYVRTWDEFEFLPGAIDTIRVLTERGYEIHIVSNQAGIARGEVREENLRDIHARMTTEIEKRGGRITSILYCPHGWDDGCDCRKPKPGMLLKIAHDHHFDATKAIFVGDDLRDKEAGDAAGCKTILVNKEMGLAEALPRLL